MKTATCLLFLGCLTNACLGQQDAAAARRAILEANAAQHRAQMAQARAEEARNMKEVVFSEESVSVSEPSDRLLFEHETNVDNFLSTAGKFGLSRILTIHLSNPRYATHGGVMKVPGFDKDGWNTAGHRYQLARPWGMLGDLDQAQPRAYLFRPSPDLRRGKKSETAPEEPEAEESALNRFEEHALAMLRKGEKLVRWENERTMHAVGAVRAETQCLRCHEGSKAGDLLGAFTYSFAKTGVVPPDEKTAQIVKLHDERKTPLQIAEAVGLLKPPAEAEFPGVKTFAITQLHQALLSQGIVTAEMLAAQAQRRKDVLNSNLGPVKKPKASAGAE